MVEHLRLKRGKVNKTKHVASLPYFVQQRLEWPEHLAHIQWVHVWINRTLWIDKETTACQQHQTNGLSTVLMKTSKHNGLHLCSNSTFISRQVNGEDNYYQNKFVVFGQENVTCFSKCC